MKLHSFFNGVLTLELTEEEINNHPFVDDEGAPAFYNYIKQLCFADPDPDLCIDCRDINVAKNIQEHWFARNRTQGKEDTEFAMLLCFAGPKAEERLPDNCVEILPECFIIQPEPAEETETTA